MAEFIPRKNYAASAEHSAQAVSKSLYNFLNKAKEIGEQREFKQDYINIQLVEYGNKATTEILTKIDNFIFELNEFEQDHTKKFNEEIQAFKPITDNQRIIYLLSKIDIKDKLVTKNVDGEIIKQKTEDRSQESEVSLSGI